MTPKGPQKIQIEKLRQDPLPPLNQAVTANHSDFLGTALISYTYSAYGCRHKKKNTELEKSIDFRFLFAYIRSR
jgi:hypothetical protein